MLLPNEIRNQVNLSCSHVWRSIGTHIWLEFGVPKITMLRSGRRSLMGEMTVHVSSYNWRLMLENQCVLNSDTVTDENFEIIGKQWIIGNPVFIEMIESNKLELSFSTETILQIFPSDEEDDDAEVSLKLPDGQWWEFDFDLGWHLST